MPTEVFESARDRSRGEACSAHTAEFIADERQRPYEADACWSHVRFGGDAFHFHADQVVSERDTPQLLADSFGTATADCFQSVEQVGLHLVEAHLQLPTLMVEGDD